uniref:Transcriptional regulator MraZ n=1 Tax=Eiseniibacteriota bacterium TaxID=2212470 RepID=A0A832HZ91_UNCEI
MNLYGTQTYKIDDKGRLAVPASMRRAARGRKGAPSFMLVMGFEGCLALYAPEQWARVEERLRRIPIGDRKGRAFVRAFLMDATPVTVDAQGRITIPPALLRRADLGKEAVLHGLGSRIEIWNPERLGAELSQFEGQFESLAADVVGED